MGVAATLPELSEWTKLETKRKLQQFTVSLWLVINMGASDS